MNELKAVVAKLLSPAGCPWDRKQTHRSLIPYLREESEELAVALRRGRWHEIEDELGDILFHVMFHAMIAEKAGLFSLEDVVRSQALKLKRRHPHVFARDRKFKNAAEVLRHWKEIKSKERALRDIDVAKRAASRRRKTTARSGPRNRRSG